MKTKAKAIKAKKNVSGYTKPKSFFSSREEIHEIKRQTTKQEILIVNYILMGCLIFIIYKYITKLNGEIQIIQ
jgi:hypothetical protein